MKKKLMMKDISNLMIIFPNNIKDKKIKKDVLQMIKSFYKGITFTIGILVCLYSLFGVIKFAQTTDDAIIYSIWLLIGVILIK